MGPGGVGGEPVAGGHPASTVRDAHPVHGSPGPVQIAGGELHPVHRGHQSHTVAQGAGIHIVLQKALRQNDGTNGHILEAPGHTGVEHQVRLIQADQQLGGHGGVDLADAPGAGDDVRPDLIKRHPGHGLQGLSIFLGQQAFDLAGHGVYKSDFHGWFPPDKFDFHPIL